MGRRVPASAVSELHPEQGHLALRAAVAPGSQKELPGNVIATVSYVGSRALT